VNRLLEIAASLSSWQQLALLDGMIATAPASKSKAAAPPKPIVFNAEPDAFAALKKTQTKEVLERLKQISSLVTWPGQPGFVAPPKVVPLTEEQQKQFAFGKDLYAVSCAACHQLTGLGMDGLAPPLADSEWVLGSPENLARIILHGIRGPISVKGKVWEMEMPALGVFDDEQVAAVLTYIRREWEHGATPVDAGAVEKIRSATANRIEAWTEAELQKIP
jgi:mono/diheme cytochrome c family protein